jgi:hypothetical protein
MYDLIVLANTVRAFYTYISYPEDSEEDNDEDNEGVRTFLVATRRHVVNSFVGFLDTFITTEQAHR